MKLVYPIILYPMEEHEGGYTVEVPDLPGCVTEGHDLADALDMAIGRARKLIGDDTLVRIQDGRFFLDASRVLASSGERIDAIDGHIEDLKKLDPAYIFLCYGINDLGWYGSAQDYADTLLEKLRLLRRELPEAVIVVSSILSLISRSSRLMASANGVLLILVRMITPSSMRAWLLSGKLASTRSLTASNSALSF